MTAEWDMSGWDYLISEEDARRLIRWRQHIVETCSKEANAGNYHEADMWYQAGGLCLEDFEAYLPGIGGLG